MITLTQNNTENWSSWRKVTSRRLHIEKLKKVFLHTQRKQALMITWCCLVLTSSVLSLLPLGFPYSSQLIFYIMSKAKEAEKQTHLPILSVMSQRTVTNLKLPNNLISWYFDNVEEPLSTTVSELLQMFQEVSERENNSSAETILAKMRELIDE